MHVHVLLMYQQYNLRPIASVQCVHFRGRFTHAQLLLKQSRFLKCTLPTTYLKYTIDIFLGRVPYT